MKVLAIRGCNLASIEGEFEVDFTSSPLSDCGLFAISGPTGAGKSTLLDALCLALYHNTPRLLMATERDIKIPDTSDQDISPQDPRNLLRRGCGSGFAEVDFVGIDGAAWRARWEVRRARERPNGKLQNASVRLESCDGITIVAEQLKETASAIEARVGLSFDQFRRAVLLAQNDFATLLKAKQNERADLLEALTSTEVFSALSRLAHERATAAKREIEQMRQKLEIMPTLSDEARSELEAAIGEKQATVTGLEQRIDAIGNERTWHNEVQQRGSEVTVANEALETRQAKDAAHTQSDAQLGRWSTLLPLQANWMQQRQLVTDIESFDHQISNQAGVIELATSIANEKKEALTEANERLDKANKAKENSAPCIAEARKLDQKITQAEVRRAGYATDIEAVGKDLAAALKDLQRLSAEHERLIEKIDNWRDWQASQPDFTMAEDRWPNLGQHLNTCCENKGSREELTRALREAEVAIEQQTERREAARNAFEARKSDQNQFQSELRGSEERVTSLRPAALEHERMTWRRKQEEVFQAQRCVETLEREERQLQTLEEAINELDVAKQARTGEHAEVTKAEQRAQDKLGYAEHARKQAQLAANAHTEQLRAALVEGEPCLVCGATVHPGVDHDNSGVQVLLAELDRQFGDARDDFEQAKEVRISLSTRLDELESQRQARQAQVEGSRGRLAETRIGVIEAMKSLDLPQDVAIKAHRASEALDALRSELDTRDKALGVREQELITTRKQVDQARARQEQAREATEHAQEQLLALERELQPLQQAAAGHRARLDAVSEAIDTAERALTDLGFAPRRGFESTEDLLATWTEGNAFRQAAIDARTPLEGIKANLVSAQQTQNRNEARQSSLTAELAKLSDELTTLRKERAVTLEAEDTETFAESLDQQVTDATGARDVAQRSHQAAKDAQTKSEGDAKTCADRREDREQRLQHTRAALQKGLSELPASFGARPTLEELDTLIPAIPDDLETVLQALSDRKQALRDATTVLATTRAALKRLQDEPKSDREQEAVEADWKALQENLQESRETLANRRFQLAQDNSHRAKAADHRAEIDAKEQAAERWHRLDALIGSASGDKFKRYAQQFTLEILLEYANQHLDRLAPRYQLQRGNENLSLLVVDRDFGDELRSVHSLSGGESFLVALGLALALASLSSERVRVESLFIDEGFGSLDAETLNMVMEALDRLQSEGRRIGVISHVHDMAERIGTQIRVVPTGRGRSRIEVVA